MEHVTFEIAKKLKDKGFPQHITDEAYIVDNYGDDECDIGDRLPILLIPDYVDDIAAPTISQTLKWLREGYHIHIEIVSVAYGYDLIINDTPDKGATDRYYSYANDDGPNDRGAWDSYEDCVLYGINYTLDNLI